MDQHGLPDLTRQLEVKAKAMLLKSQVGAVAIEPGFAYCSQAIPKFHKLLNMKVKLPLLRKKARVNCKGGH
ncbi:MAG: hypothetical protein Kow00107_03350 [Planctomycetota bacterium]